MFCFLCQAAYPPQQVYPPYPGPGNPPNNQGLPTYESVAYPTKQ